MARTNLQIKEGSYTGTGVAQAITGIGFRPDIVIVKGGSNAAVFRTKQVGSASVDNTIYFGANTASTTGLITEIQNDGFSVGTGANTNTNATVYYYIAIKGNDAQSYFRTLYYRGTGAGSRALNTMGLNFTPDFWGTKKEGNDNPAWVTSLHTGGNSSHWSAVADTTGIIDNVISNGVTLNTSTRSNGANQNYHGFALKNLNGIIKVGSYVGTGAAQSVTNVGFKPDILLLKNSATTADGFLMTNTIGTGGAYDLGGAGQSATTVTSLDDNGFTLGTAASVNGSTNTIWYIALKSGSFNVPITRSAS